MGLLNRLIDAVAERIPRDVWAGLTLLAGCSILYMGMRPGDTIPNFNLLLAGIDKVLHFTAYACLATCVWRSIYPVYTSKTPAISHGWLLVILVPAMVGFLDETFQSITPGRSADYRDWIADALAGIIVCAVGLYSRKAAGR